MACPFSGAVSAPSSDGGGCPFARALQAGAAPAATSPPPAAPPAPAHEHAQEQHGRQEQPKPPAVCPYGFGSSSGGGAGRGLGALECMLCRGALKHEAVAALPCRHEFCAACIAAARDCPACGRDILGLEPASETRALVEAYMEGHGSKGGALPQELPPAFSSGGGGGPAAPADASPSTFFLLHGLRSLMGGNVDAALHRLGRCRELLLSEAGGAAAAGEGAPPLASALRLGAVCGSLGDCWRRRGDLAAAEAALQESAAHLRAHAAADAEAAAALGVTLGKLGDLQFFRAQADAAAAECGPAPAPVAEPAAAAAAAAGGTHRAEASPEARAARAALPYYQSALQQRRAVVGPLSGGRAGAGATLDLVAGLAKVADAHETLGDGAEAQRHWRQAAAELHELKLLAAAAQGRGGGGGGGGGGSGGGDEEGAGVGAGGGAAGLGGPEARKLAALEDLLALRGHAGAAAS